MPLFGFSDISFNKGVTTRKGPLGALVDNKFKTTTLRYPIDIGNYDKSHYMVFYVRQQEKTQFRGTVVEDDAINAATNTGSINNASLAGKLNSLNPQNLASSVGGELLNKVNSGLDQINQATGGALSSVSSALGKTASNVVGDIQNLFGQKTSLIGGNSAATQDIINKSIKSITDNSFLKTTQLTTDAIALYMPDTLQYTYSQSYDQLNIGGELLGQALAAGATVKDAFKEGQGTLDTIKKTAAAGAESGGTLAAQRIAGGIGSLTGSQQTAQLGFTAITGKVQNPMLEMIYKSPNFRTFQFDFTFYPRDEREALEVQKIIERFRFHQAPEIVKGAQGFLIPPSEFDIRFYYGGGQNPNIPKITTCILTTIDVNYAPNGWSAYEVPGENNANLGRTGMPVAIQMTLQFQEKTYLTKRDFDSSTDYSDDVKSQFTKESQSGQYGTN
jgi:hypothetical protein